MLFSPMRPIGQAVATLRAEECPFQNNPSAMATFEILVRVNVLNEQRSNQFIEPFAHITHPAYGAWF